VTSFVDDVDPTLQNLAVPAVAVPNNVPEGGSAKTESVLLAIVALDSAGVRVASPGTVSVTVYEVIPSGPSGRRPFVLEAVASPVVVTPNTKFAALGVAAGTYAIRLTSFALTGTVASIHIYVKPV
jgi:hypothetical protein